MSAEWVMLIAIMLAEFGKITSISIGVNAAWMRYYLFAINMLLQSPDVNSL